MGFVAEAIALTDAGRFCYRWLFPAILNLKLKPVRELLLLATFTKLPAQKNNEKHRTVRKLRSLVSFVESARKIRRFRIFMLIAQSLFLQIVDVHFETDETNQRPMP